MEFVDGIHCPKCGKESVYITKDGLSTRQCATCEYHYLPSNYKSHKPSIWVGLLNSYFLFPINSILYFEIKFKVNIRDDWELRAVYFENENEKKWHSLIAPESTILKEWERLTKLLL